MTKKVTKRTLLPSAAYAASAVMLTLIHPPFEVASLAWVGLVPFILASSATVKWGRLAVSAYIISACYWLGNLYWIAPVTLPGWAAFCLYTALLWPILVFAIRFCRARNWPLFIAVPILVVGAEQLQGLFLGGFYWRLLGHSQYRNIGLIQFADIFGAGGVSFLIAMVNGLVAEMIIAIQRRSIFKPGNFLKMAAVCAAVVGAIVYGRWRIGQSDKFIETGPLVASLQSNVPQYVKREGLRGAGESAEQTSKEIFDELMHKSKAAATAGAELIVWPETMVQATLNTSVLRLLSSSHSCKIFDQALRDHAKETAFVLVGAYGSTPKIGEDWMIHFAQRYNSAFLYRPDGQQDQKRYDKIHLVLFGEVLPFRKSCPFLFNLLMKFNPLGYDHSLDAGSEYTVFEMTSGKGQQTRVYKFGVMICYEDTIPSIARRFVLDGQGQKRLDWLVNISNDGWFVSHKKGQALPTTELAQHTAICVFRAVENRIAVVRSVNTGVSCLIDTIGRVKDGFEAGNLPIKAMARQGVSGWFADKVPIDKRSTFFSKYGQWLDFCCALCLGLTIIGPPCGRFISTRFTKNGKIKS